MTASEPWGAVERQRPFLEAARQVLNADAFCVTVPSAATPRTVDDSNFIDIVRELLADPALVAPLTAAVLAEDPIVDYLRCSYTPPANLHSVSISKLSELAARKRLESMLLGSAPYQSPYDKAVPRDRAAALVTAFLGGFDPRPTHFAEIDPAALRDWIWIERSHTSPPFPEALDMNALPKGYAATPFLDGFYDSVIALGAGERVALLINNGSD